MNWLQKISQNLLSTNFEIETQKIGTVFVELQCSFDDYDRWWKYKHGPQGWTDSQVRDSEALNRSIEMEPSVRLHISHRFSGMMPQVDRPDRTQQESDAFDIVGDQMTNLKNDEFYETVRIKDVGETIRSWLFMPINSIRRADPQDSKLKMDLSNEIFGALESLFQQYSQLT